MIVMGPFTLTVSILPTVLLTTLLLCLGPGVNAEGMFQDWNWALPRGTSQLNYGVAVTNVGDGHGPMEWVVAGFSGSNLVLQYDPRNGRYRNIAEEDPAYTELRDPEGAAIGVCACDIDGDGLEEIYFLNTNNRYSGPKLVRDRLFKWRNNRYEDLFSDDVNSGVSSMYSGRSVACIDRTGSGKYGFLLATYSQNAQGKFGLIEMNEYDPGNDIQNGRIVLHNVAEEVGIDFSTGGRGVTVGPIIGGDGFSDIFFVNEGNSRLGNRGDNALFVNDGNGNFVNVAGETNLDDSQPGRGVTLADFNNDGKTDIVYGNWMGPHRIQIQNETDSGQPVFNNVATSEFATPSPIRTVIAADFDNSGELQVFMNNIVYYGEDASNRLFRIIPVGTSVQVREEDVGDAVEPRQHGTGAAVADIDQDGVLELMVAHGESKSQGLTFYHVTPSKVEGNHWVRVLPLTQNGAPARGAKVVLRLDDGTRLSRIIDGGSGYLCEMEPVAHFGIGSNSGIRELKIIWPDNHQITKGLTVNDVNTMFTISHYGEMRKVEPAANIVISGYDTKRGPNDRDAAVSQDSRRGRLQDRGSYHRQTMSSRRTTSRNSRPEIDRSTRNQRSRQRKPTAERDTQAYRRQRYRQTDRGERKSSVDREAPRIVVRTSKPRTSNQNNKNGGRETYWTPADLERRRQRQRQAQLDRMRRNQTEMERRRNMETERRRSEMERKRKMEKERRRRTEIERRKFETERRQKLDMENRKLKNRADTNNRLDSAGWAEIQRRREIARRQAEYERRRQNAQRTGDDRRRYSEGERRRLAARRAEENARRDAEIERRKSFAARRPEENARRDAEIERRKFVAARRPEENARRDAEIERRKSFAARRAEENARRDAEIERRKSLYSNGRAAERERLNTRASNSNRDEKSGEYWRRITEQRRRENARRAEERRRNSFRKAEIDRERGTHETQSRRGYDHSSRFAGSTKRPGSATREAPATSYENRHRESSRSRDRERYSRRRFVPTEKPRESNWDRWAESSRYRTESGTSMNRRQYYRARPSQYRSAQTSESSNRVLAAKETKNTTPNRVERERRTYRGSPDHRQKVERIRSSYSSHPYSSAFHGYKQSDESPIRHPASSNYRGRA